MPYVTQNMRYLVDTIVYSLADEIQAMGPEFNLQDHEYRAGILNYVITKLLKEVYGDDLRYKDINEIIGMLECCKQEYYRKIAAPYEDQKERENGPV